jgi:hypothetical protein
MEALVEESAIEIASKHTKPKGLVQRSSSKSKKQDRQRTAEAVPAQRSTSLNDENDVSTSGSALSNTTAPLHSATTSKTSTRIVAGGGNPKPPRAPKDSPHPKSSKHSSARTSARTATADFNPGDKSEATPVPSEDGDSDSDNVDDLATLLYSDSPIAADIIGQQKEVEMSISRRIALELRAQDNAKTVADEDSAPAAATAERRASLRTRPAKTDMYIHAKDAPQHQTYASVQHAKRMAKKSPANQLTGPASGMPPPGHNPAAGYEARGSDASESDGDDPVESARDAVAARKTATQSPDALDVATELTRHYAVNTPDLQDMLERTLPDLDQLPNVGDAPDTEELVAQTLAVQKDKDARKAQQQVELQRQLDDVTPLVNPKPLPYTDHHVRLAANAAVDAATAEPMLQIPPRPQGQSRAKRGIAPAPAPASRNSDAAPISDVTRRHALTNAQEERAQDERAQRVTGTVNVSDHEEGELPLLDEPEEQGEPFHPFLPSASPAVLAHLPVYAHLPVPAPAPSERRYPPGSLHRVPPPLDLIPEHPAVPPASPLTRDKYARMEVELDSRKATILALLNDIETLEDAAIQRPNLLSAVHLLKRIQCAEMEWSTIITAATEAAEAAAANEQTAQDQLEGLLHAAQISDRQIKTYEDNLEEQALQTVLRKQSDAKLSDANSKIASLEARVAKLLDETALPVLPPTTPPAKPRFIYAHAPDWEFYDTQSVLEEDALVWTQRSQLAWATYCPDILRGYRAKSDAQLTSELARIRNDITSERNTGHRVSIPASRDDVIRSWNRERMSKPHRIPHPNNLSSMSRNCSSQSPMSYIHALRQEAVVEIQGERRRDAAAVATVDRRREFKRPGSAKSRTADTKRARYDTRYDAPSARDRANRYDRDAARPNERRRHSTRDPNTRDPDPRDSRPRGKRRAPESDSDRDQRCGTDTERYKPVRVHEERHDRGTRNLERRDHSRDHSNHSRSNSRSDTGSDEIYIPSPIKDLHGQDSN